MLEHTFIHLPGVGPTTERRLWAQGITTWADALDARACPLGFSNGRWSMSCRTLEESVRSLQRGDYRHFARSLASPEHWRAWPDFRRRAACLDIETTGCASSDMITVIGLYDGVRTYSLIAGDNLDQFPELVSRYALLVTFNGSSFDLPFLRRRFPGLVLDQIHIDLMHVLRRLGLRGGLKAIERAAGIARDEDIAHLDGWDAVRLWREFRRGRQASLDLLVRYNAADIGNLERLAELAYAGLRQRMAVPADGGGSR
ncbi:MAG: ribonuclease H-like domain-containing protein [Armatimonadota bacterium]